MNVCGKDIQVSGGLIRVARLAAERDQFLQEPAAALDALRASNTRIDLFTFMPTVSHPSQYDYHWSGTTSRRCPCRPSITGGRTRSTAKHET